MYGGFWVRLRAFLVDIFIAAAIAATINAGLSFAGLFRTVKHPVVLFYIIFFISVFLYWVLFESSKLQATPGKLSLGIKVVNLHGAKAGLLRIFFRNACKLFSILTLNAGFIMAGFTQKRQALHDKISGCLVISKNADINDLPLLPKTSALKIIFAIAGGFMPFIIIFGAIVGAMFIGKSYFLKAQDKKADIALQILRQIKAAQPKGAYIEDFALLNIPVFDIKGNTAEYEGYIYTLLPYGASVHSKDKYNTLTICYAKDTVCLYGKKADLMPHIEEAIQGIGPANCCL